MRSVNKKTMRQNMIMSLVNNEDYTKIKDIVKKLDVSEMTIRRDLQELSSTGEISIVNGVVMKENTQYYLRAAADAFREQKRKIGETAAKLICDGDIVAIDAGTTTEQIVKSLPQDMNITVICYNVNILNELLKKRIKKIVFAGGVYHENTQMFEGEDGINLIKKYRATKAFISTAGFTFKLGATCIHDFEMHMKKTVMSLSYQNFLVTDSSKYNRITPSYFADIAEFSAIIIDEGMTKEAEDGFNKLGIKIYTA